MVFEEIRRTIRLKGSHEAVLAPTASLVHQVRLTRRLGAGESQSHLPSQDEDGVSLPV
jgi:hypothetical protein